MSLKQDLDYTGRRVLVTGAAIGIGRAMATQFAAAGAMLIMADFEGDTLLPAVSQLGAEAHFFDQSSGASINALADAVGDVDALVNNAGVLVAKPLLETTTAETRG